MATYRWWLFAAYLLMVVCGYGLKGLNIRHLQKVGDQVPEEFSGQIEPGELRRTRDYVVSKTYWDFFSSGCHHALLLFFLFSPWLDRYNQWIFYLPLPWLLQGIVFFWILYTAWFVLGLPFDLYQTFRIEKRFGFNTMSGRLWLMDQLKSFLLSTLLLVLLSGIFLELAKTFPRTWWLWVWGCFLGFTLILYYISPYVLDPLFNRFTPLAEGSLNQDIRALAEKVGVRVSRIFQMDASRRSRHTNAYFTGIGRVKRIVLFDTLLEKMSAAEILAVLAHELGHWQRKHISKRMLLSQTLLLAGWGIAYLLVQSSWLPAVFALRLDTLWVKLILLGFLSLPIQFLFQPLLAAYSRQQEQEADALVKTWLGETQSLISALVKLTKDNLINLHPHPWYALFYYSHPPIIKRLQQLRARANKSQPQLDRARQETAEKEK